MPRLRGNTLGVGVDSGDNTRMTETIRKASSVFIVFAHADAGVAHALADALRDKGMTAALDDQAIEPGERWADRLRSEFATVDFVLFLVSARFLSSVWAHQATSAALVQAMRVMSTAFVAAALDDSARHSDLGRLMCLDLRDPSVARCDDIAARFRSVADLSLSTLSAPRFEQLVLRLFTNRGFEAIDTSGQADQWWDFLLHRRNAQSHDPRNSQKVFVECKYYAHQRPGIRELSELYQQANSLPPDCKALLATNARLTSVARDWLARHERATDARPRLDILDGPELTRMLLADPTIADTLDSQTPAEDDRES